MELELTKINEPPGQHDQDEDMEEEHLDEENLLNLYDLIKLASYKCDECGQPFTIKSELIHHIKSKHLPALSLFECSYCKRLFARQSVLAKHKEKHEYAISKYKYSCKYCGLKVRTPKGLFAHYASRHKDENPFECVHCQLVFNSRRLFGVHIRSVHRVRGTMKFAPDFSVTFTPDPGFLENRPSSPAAFAVKALPVIRQLKLNFKKNLEICERVIIKKITEEEAKRKPNMVF